MPILGELRPTGNDNNGGFYATGYSPSTDYTQQDTPAASFTDLSTSAAGATTITTATGGVPLDAAGNYIQITGGTNFTKGWYLITSVTNSNTFVVSSSPTPSAAGSGGIGAIGGALASPAWACQGPVAAIIWAKAGTYNITTGTANVPGGLVQPANGLQKCIYGYYQTRGDWPTNPAQMPYFLYTATTQNVVIFQGGVMQLWNVVVDVNNVPGCSGVYNLEDAGASHRAKVVCCLFKNAPAYGITSYSTIAAFYCAAVNCGYGFQCICYNCYAEKCTNAGFYGVGRFINCVYYGNGGAGRGFLQPYDCVNCVAVGAGSDGFGMDQAAGNIFCMNCVAVNSGGYGFNLTNSYYVSLLNCAAYGNTSGNLSSYLASSKVIGFQNLTANPFASATDFSLNNTAGGGAGLRGADYIGLIPVPGFGLATGTTFKRDVGAGQHLESGGGTTLVWPQLVKILGSTESEG